MDCSDKTVLRLSGALKAELTSLVVLGTLGTSVRGLQVLSALLTPATRSWPQLEPAYLEKWCRKLPGTRSERASGQSFWHRAELFCECMGFWTQRKRRQKQGTEATLCGKCQLVALSIMKPGGGQFVGQSIPVVPHKAVAEVSKIGNL